MKSLTPYPPVDRLSYSVLEAARALGLGRDTTYGLIRSGQLPSLKVGRRRIIPRAAVEAFLAKASRDAEDLSA